jgi:HrpA-like RNA helicase
MFFAEQPVPSYLTASVDAVVAIHSEAGPGDILVFLTGQDEVGRRMRRRLN